MKQIILIITLGTLSLAGFFNESANADKAEYLENDRLCKMFTKKVEVYKKTIRSDFLAATTLSSYEHRASLFCKKADGIKNDLSPEVLHELNITSKINRSESNTSKL